MLVGFYNMPWQCVVRLLAGCFQSYQVFCGQRMRACRLCTTNHRTNVSACGKFEEDNSHAHVESQRFTHKANHMVYERKPRLSAGIRRRLCNITTELLACLLLLLHVKHELNLPVYIRQFENMVSLTYL